MEVKDIIRNRRTELGLTMKELAEKVGVNEGTISRWESGDIANMRRDKIAALARVLGIEPNVLMEWEETPKEEPYYMNAEAKEYAEFLFRNPKYRVLFDASRKVKPEDLEMVQKIIEKFGGKDEP